MPKTKVSYGVDFGTSTTLVAEKLPEQRPIALPIGDATRGSLPWFPSVVSQDEAGGFRIGEDAASIGQTPIRSIKRLLEERPGDERLDCLRKDLARQGLCRDGHDTLLRGSRRFSLKEMVTALLSEARQRAERAKGKKIAWNQMPVHIGCSVHFRKRSRQLLVECANCAGFEALKLIDVLPEPVAAALAVLKWNEEILGGDDTNEAICVSDFGGGTFDVACVLRYEGRLYVLVDDAVVLGGDDMDRELEELVLEALKKHYRICRDEVFDLLGNGDTDFGNYDFQSRCEAAKRILSERQHVTFQVPQRIELRVRIDRQAFEERIQGIVQRALEVRSRAVSACGKIYGREQFPLKHYLLGGASLTPLVQEKLEGKHIAAIDPVDAIALGEAYAEEYDHLDRGRPQYDIVVEGLDRQGKTLTEVAYAAFDPLWTPVCFHAVGGAPAWRRRVDFGQFPSCLSKVTVLAQSVEDGAMKPVGHVTLPSDMRRHRSITLLIHTNHEAAVESVDGECWGRWRLPSYSSAILKSDPSVELLDRIVGRAPMPVHRGCGGDDEPG